MINVYIKTIFSRFNLTRAFTRNFTTNFPIILNQNQIVNLPYKTQGLRVSPIPIVLGSFLTVGLCESQKKDEQCKKEEKCLKCKKCGCEVDVSSRKCTSCLWSCDNNKPITWGKQDLTHCFLMKQANVLTIDAVTRVLSETVSTIEDYHSQYRNLLEMLIELMEESRCASENQQELIHCKIIVVRSSIEEMKSSIIELDCYLESVTRLADAAAETAFLASAEYASVALMERLHSAKAQISKIKDETQELERTSNELHALIIVESGKGLK